MSDEPQLNRHSARPQRRHVDFPIPATSCETTDGSSSSHLRDPPLATTPVNRLEDHFKKKTIPGGRAKNGTVPYRHPAWFAHCSARRCVTGLGTIMQSHSPNKGGVGDIRRTPRHCFACAVLPRPSAIRSRPDHSTKRQARPSRRAVIFPGRGQIRSFRMPYNPLWRTPRQDRPGWHGGGPRRCRKNRASFGEFALAGAPHFSSLTSEGQNDHINARRY